MPIPRPLAPIAPRNSDLATEPAQPPPDRTTELESENQRQKDTNVIQSLQKELTNMACELQEYKNLSEIRGRELIGAQFYLTKADRLSISDVKDKVNALNTEIVQASAFLGDSLVPFTYELAKEDTEAAFVDASRTISEPVAHTLKATRKRPEINQLLMQVVLEMYFVHFCSSKIESWFPGTRKTSDFLTTIYSEIRRTEEQAVSGRWRALTRAHIRPTSVTWKAEFMKGLDNICKIAEWRVGSSRPHGSIEFEQRLPAIFKAVEDLRVALGEKVTSIDLEVNVARPGVAFDHRWMEEAYRYGSTQNSHEIVRLVAGTTGIGLKKVVPSPSGEELFENVLSPKVIIMSTLQEALRTPSPAPFRSNKMGRLRQGRVRGDQGQGTISVPSKAPPPVKEVITTTNKILSHSRSDTLGLTKNPQMTASDDEHNPLSAEGVIVDAKAIPPDRRHDLGFTPTTATDEERDSLLAARAIVDGSGAAPVMVVIDAVLTLRKEIAKVSNFLAENIRHTSYELFQEEFDRCYQDLEKIIGERLSKFLHERSEKEELSETLIKMTIQLFMVSFCASEWKHYLDTALDVETTNNPARNPNEQKTGFLRNLVNVFKVANWVIPGSANRAAFEESLNPFFKSMSETEIALKKVPEFSRVSLSFAAPGKDTTKLGIQTSDGPSPVQDIVLGTTAFGVRCRFQDRITGVNEDKPRTLLTAKVISESNLPSIFGIQGERKPRTTSSRTIFSQSTAQRGDGRDP